MLFPWRWVTSRNFPFTFITYLKLFFHFKASFYGYHYHLGQFFCFLQFGFHSVSLYLVCSLHPPLPSPFTTLYFINCTSSFYSINSYMQVWYVCSLVPCWTDLPFPHRKKMEHLSTKQCDPPTSSPTSPISTFVLHTLYASHTWPLFVFSRLLPAIELENVPLTHHANPLQALLQSVMCFSYFHYI